MIRDYVLMWGSIILVAVLAFILMPTYERFKDAQGKEVDVDPNAPPMPEWLKPSDPRKENFDNPNPISVTTKPTSIANTNSQKSTAPPPPPMPQSTPKKGDDDYEDFSRFCKLCETNEPIDAFLQMSGGASQQPEVVAMFKQDPAWQSWAAQAQSLCKQLEFQGPPPTTTASTTLSGVKTIPSQSMPAQIGSSSMMTSIGSDLGIDKQVLTNTLPGPSFDKSGGPQGIDNGYGDKYVLKSSLVPCTSGSCSQVPGQPGPAGDGISKPFSAAFGDKTEPEGYLNSFSAFMK